MKVMIEIDDGTYAVMLNAIANGTPLNGTNGEVLKAVFGDVKTIQYKGWVDVEINHNHFRVCEDWWNAEYKGVE